MAGNSIKMKDLPVAESSRVTDLIGLDTQGQSVKLPNEQNKIKTEVANLGTKVGELPYAADIEEQGYATGLADDKGNVALAVDNEGNLLSKKFNSAETPKQIDGEDSDLDVADEQGNVILRLRGGELQTKNFDSSKTASATDPDVETYDSRHSSDLSVSDSNGEVIADFVNGHIRTKNFDSSNISFDDYTLQKRRAVVSFSFDDNSSRDQEIKEAFDECDAKCGFAIIQALGRYKEWYQEGFEVLAHGGGTWGSGKTEEEVRTLLSTQKAVVESLGVPCVGWVTPSSALQVDLRYLVYDYFGYGFTISKGSVSDVNNAVMYKDSKSYELWRSSVYSLTLQQCKDIIDKAAQTGGMVHFYTHANDLDKTAPNGEVHNVEKIKAIINYAKEKAEVLTPYKACKKYYAYRVNEDFIN